MEIRPVLRGDVPAVVAMAHELAEYEKAPELCHLTDEALAAGLFAAEPAVFAHVAVEDGEPVGFMLWFLTYSTWEGNHGIHLEDLFVRPAARGTGAGRALLATLARVCAERGYPRLEWHVLDWNPARGFYDSLGAGPLDEWVPYRLTGQALTDLAATAPTAVS